MQDILDKVDACDYIGQYVSLEQNGSDYFALCPFHEEDTPSFSVTPSTGLYYCFGCKAGGNAIGFTAR